MSNRIQFRRDTRARWAEINPVLMEGEVGLEVDTQNIKMGDGTHAWNDLEYGVGYSNVTNEPGNNENLVISQKATTELVRGVKDGMTASEYPTIRIEDFAVGVTETGSDRTAKVLEKFNAWLNAVDFSLSGKHIGHCIVGLDGRNGDVYNYVFSHENKYGVQVLMGGYGIKSDGTIYNVDSYNILYRICNNGTNGEWIDYSIENIVSELGDNEKKIVSQKCITKVIDEITINILGKDIKQTFTTQYQWGDIINTIPIGAKIKNIGEIEINLYNTKYGDIHTELDVNEEKVTEHEVSCLRSVRTTGIAQIHITGKIEEVEHTVGDLSNLSTITNKDLVSALNEVNSKTLIDGSVAENNLSASLHEKIFKTSKSINLFNPNDADYKIGYLSGNTGYVQPNNPSYFTSGFVAVEPGKTYFSGKIGASYPNNVFSFALFYDSNKAPIGERLSNQANLVAPTNASYLRVSMDTGALKEMMISEGQQYPYEPYKEPTTTINLNGAVVTNDNLQNNSITENKLSEDVINKINASSVIVNLSGLTIKGDLSDGRELVLPKNSIITDKIITFSAKIDSFSKIIIGHGHTNYDAAYFEIDGTNIKDGIANTTNAHGLSITNNIQVTIIKRSIGGSKIILASNGSEKEVTIWNSYGNGNVFVKSEGSVLSDCSLSFYAKNIMADTWCFGDSYFSLMNARWVYYLIRDGFNNTLLNGYSGQRSSLAFEDLQNLLTMATPKRIVWCLGMNDIDTNNTVNASWKSTYDKLVELAEKKGIEIILSTIPCACGGISPDDVSGNNGKFRNNNYKNEIVRASGKRFIDFESAVGADKQTGLWYGTTEQDIYDKTNNGMLSKDGVHPTIKGAISLYHKAISDCPELMS